MNHLALLLSVLILSLVGLSCTNTSSNNLEPSQTVASINASKGVGIYIAEPGKDIAEGVSCQIDLSKLQLVGIPLTESDIDYFDQSKGLFKLKVSQYDWLGGNKTVISTARRRGYYAMALTLDGQPVFGGYVLSGFSSYACTSGEPYFLEDLTYGAPNPGPNPRSDYSYTLPLKRMLKANSPKNDEVPQINSPLLTRLKAVGKLKN